MKKSFIALLTFFIFNQLTYALVYQESSLWEQNENLKILFLNGSASQKERFKSTVIKWTPYMNLTLEFYEKDEITIEEADIKVGLGSSICDFRNQSLVGISARNYNKGPTICLYQLKKTSTILHEFGHALGLKHEHNHPEAFAMLKENLIDLCMQVNAQLEWTRETCELNYTPSKNLTYGTYDRNSIMGYSFKEYFYKNSEDYIPGSLPILSLGDRLAINELYPGHKTPGEIEEEYEKEISNLNFNGCVIKNIDEAKTTGDMNPGQTCPADKPFFSTKMHTDENGNITWSRFKLDCDRTREYAIRRMVDFPACNL